MIVLIRNLGWAQLSDPSSMVFMVITLLYSAGSGLNRLNHTSDTLKRKANGCKTGLCWDSEPEYLHVTLPG